MIKELFAVCLLVDNFEKSMNFYKDMLGLKVGTVNETFADFKINGTSLAIFQKNEALSMFSRKYMNAGGGCVLAFQVVDIKKAITKLKANGIEIFEGPKTTAWGQTVAYFLDPDKNIWEISEPLE